MSNPFEVPVNEFGPVIFSYTRAQAIEDGVLVDLTKLFPKLVKEAGIKLHLAMTSTAFVECVGPICTSEDDLQNSALPAGQSYEGRLWDVLMVLRAKIKTAPPGEDRVHFKLNVWDGHNSGTVALWTLVGPGDQGEPVFTVMLEGED